MMSLNKTSKIQMGHSKITTIHIASTETLSTRCKNYLHKVMLVVPTRSRKMENAKKERQKQRKTSSD